MAFDPIQEDCLRLILANMEREAFSSSKTPCTSIVPPRRSKTTPRRSSTPIVSARFTWYPRQRRSSTTVRRSHRPNRTPRRSSTLRRTTCARRPSSTRAIGMPSACSPPCNRNRTTSSSPICSTIAQTSNATSSTSSRTHRTPTKRSSRAIWGSGPPTLDCHARLAAVHRRAVPHGPHVRRGGPESYPLDMAGIRHTGMLALAKLEVRPRNSNATVRAMQPPINLRARAPRAAHNPAATHRTRGALSRR